jgi:hypothetical protein
MNVTGTWALEVSTPIGKYPATLVVEPLEKGGLTGRIDSRLGTAPLSDILSTPDGFDAVVSLDVQGKTYEARVNATVSGDQIEGRIRVKSIPAPPARFTGMRSF